MFLQGNLVKKTAIFLFANILVLVLYASIIQASIVVTWSEDSGNVCASYSGTLDLAGYENIGAFGAGPVVEISSSKSVFWGNVNSEGLNRWEKTGTNGFINSGLSTGGSRFGTNNSSQQGAGFFAEGSANLYVNQSYVSGSQINGKTVFEMTTLTDLFGTNTFDAVVFNDGTNTFTFTSVPEPTSLMMFGIALVGMARRRR